MDDLLKMIREHEIPLSIETFSGDMHHDTCAHADYYSEKGILPPSLCAKTPKTQLYLIWKIIRN